jgi:hypothetical protein
VHRSFVPDQPTQDNRQGLATLLKLKHGLDSVEDAEALAELKRIVLLRIATLDAAEALEQTAIEAAAATNKENSPLEDLPKTLAS